MEIIADSQKKQGFIDIHCHILPGVDDGPASMEQSIRMLRMAAMEGITDMIVTPHQKEDQRNASPEGIMKRLRLLEAKAQELKIPVRLYPGNEIFYRHGLAELLEEGKIRTLSNTRYVLIEFFPMENFGYIRNALNELASYDYRPILAHAERYAGLTSDMGRMEDLKRSTDCLYQINASSLMGEAGFEIKSICKKLLKRGMADFVATDAHNDRNRLPKMDACAKWLIRKMGKEEADRLLIDNPLAILQNRPL